MGIEDLAKTLLRKAIECADRSKFKKCEQATRILLSLPCNEHLFSTFNLDELEKKEALENLERVDDLYCGQMWHTVGEFEKGFKRTEYDIRKWTRNDEIEWQPRAGDSRGTKLVNANFVAARIGWGRMLR